MHNTQHHNEERYLVTDKKDKPLATLPIPLILRQKQFYRLVGLIILSHTNEVFLYKKPAIPSAMRKKQQWGLMLTPVKYEESREEACYRLLQESLHPYKATIQLATSFQLLSWHNFHGMLYKTILPKGVTPTGESDKWLRTDEDELQGLLQEIPDMFAPELTWAFEKKLLFQHSKV